MNKFKEFDRAMFKSREDDPEIQLTVRENKSRPGHPIFIRDDGKIGFSTFNSISFEIGDTIKGKIRHESDKYFFVEVQEIL
jgi:hypothetical protein